MSKSETPIALIAERTNKNQAYVRNFIKRHPEFEIKKNSSNRIVMTQNQQDEICSAIQDEIKRREEQYSAMIEKRKQEAAERIAKQKEKELKRKMSQKDKDDWDALYKYVKNNVLGYDEDQIIPSKMVLRLKGLTQGKAFANNKRDDKAHYSFEVVLNTFKYSMPDIQRALNNVSFSNEMRKFLYIAKIVESNLNDVYIRMKNKKKIEEETAKEVKNAMAYKTPEFKPTIKKHNKQNKFADLW